MAQTIGSLDINAFNDLYSDSNQYFWFESNSSATHGAGAHVTLVPDTTFISNPTGQNILMNTDGFSIRNGLLPMMTLGNDSLDFNIVDTTAGTYTKTATFTATGVQIGQSSDTHSIIDANGQRFYNGTAQLANIGYGDGVDSTGGISVAPYYTFGRRLYTTSVYDSTTTYRIGDLCLHNDVEYVCITDITTPEEWNGEHWQYYIGNNSVVEGGGSSMINVGNVASGMGSHAEGRETKAIGYLSHTEGRKTRATGESSHAEGEQTTSSGLVAHAEGLSTKASANYSHSQNVGTMAVKKAQTAIGTYNKEDTSTTTTHRNGDVDYGAYAFIVGNGSSTADRSNALTIDWNGNVIASGNITDGSGNVFVSFETGTATAGSVTWKYRKWANGELEMWGSGLTTLAINTAVGNIYTTASEYNIAVPSFVDSVDFVTGELSGGGWADVTSFNVPPKLRLYAPTAYTSTNRYLRYYLKGTWS